MFRSIYRPLAWTIFLITSAGFTLISCLTQPTNPAEVSIAYKDAGSVWLQVQVQSAGEDVWLYRDSVRVALLTDFPVDTVVIDTGLTPSKSYRYQILQKWTPPLSKPVEVTTLATPSHQFVWTSYQVGDSGLLYDTAILQENDIWVVGDIVTDSMEYNAARWDGKQWHLMGLYSNTLDLYSIQHFASDDIWVTDVCSPIHWDGNTWTLYHLQNMGLDACAGNAIWGTSSSNLYFVGTSGTIVHYDGNTFTHESISIPIDLLEIAGTSNQVFVSGYNWAGDLANESVVLRRAPDGWQPLLRSQQVTGNPSTGDYGRFYGVVAFDDLAVVTSSTALLLQYHVATGAVRVQFKQHTPYAHEGINRIVGQAGNDLILVTYDGRVIHYDGKNFHRIYNLTADVGGIVDVFGADFRKDCIVLVGTSQSGQGGIIAIGRRYV